MGGPPLRAGMAGAVTLAGRVSVMWLMGVSASRARILLDPDQSYLARLYWIWRRLQNGGQGSVVSGQWSVVGGQGSEVGGRWCGCGPAPQRYSLALTRQLVAIDLPSHRLQSSGTDLLACNSQRPGS